MKAKNKIFSRRALGLWLAKQRVDYLPDVLLGGRHDWPVYGVYLYEPDGVVKKIYADGCRRRPYYGHHLLYSNEHEGKYIVL